MIDDKAELERAWAAPIFNAVHITLWHKSKWGYQWAPGIWYAKGRKVALYKPSVHARKRDNHVAAEPAEPLRVDPLAGEDPGK